MAEIARQEIAIEQLTGRLQQTGAVAPATIVDVIAHACCSIGAQPPYVRAHLDRMIAAGAWIDAALTLLELEAPQWRLRRLACDDGEWFCALSRQPQLPIELDDMAEGRHGTAAIAILIALVETRKRAAPAALMAPAGLEARHATALICDNFV